MIDRVKVPPKINARRRWIIPLAIVVPLIAVCVVLFNFNPSEHGFYPACLFHQTTGMLCAGCGATRALYQLLHGNLVTAFRYNPLFVVSLPFLVWFCIRLAVRTWRREPSATTLQPRWLWAIFVVLVLFSVVRNLPGIPPALLPPDAVPTPGLRATR